MSYGIFNPDGYHANANKRLEALRGHALRALEDLTRLESNEQDPYHCVVLHDLAWFVKQIFQIPMDEYSDLRQEVRKELRLERERKELDDLKSQLRKHLEQCGVQNE